MQEQNGPLSTGYEISHERGLPSDSHDGGDPSRSDLKNGRGDRSRTCDFYLPKVALYQAELHPDGGAAHDTAAGGWVATTVPWVLSPGSDIG